MAEDYIVNYDINVKAQPAIDAITSFQAATAKLTECGDKLMAFQKQIESVTSKFTQMTKNVPVLDISTTQANQKLDAVIKKLERIHTLAKEASTFNIAGIGVGSKKGGSKSATPTASAPPIPAVAPPPIVTPADKVGKGKIKHPLANKRVIPNNIGYRTFGPTMIDSGGVGAINFMKGMGVAYGITGLGSLMGNVLRDATGYNNIIKTTENILKTHDKLPGFARRFTEMEQLVRNVGVETKFTAPQVADASKFLAMAGFDLDAINKSIRPIANIALVGDTDLGQTADVVTNIMTGYGIKPDKISRAADVMTMTFTKTNTTLMEIAEAYKYSASLLSAAHVPFETATAAIGLLGDAGIKGSQAGTTMRTILANLVHPTNKQAERWQAIGVKRLDEQGNVRSIVDIFEDLKKKNLKVADYYGIFHKTAAQGAVSLASNVEKWNEVIYQNFLSDNVANRLAEEKKNTIQGLWYQLTSAFTEDGMQAFEELQKPIKEMLNSTISWLKTPEAVASIKNISANMMEFVKTLKDLAIDITNFYHRFSGIINLFLKAQMYALPWLVGIRMLKSFGVAAMYLGSLGKKVIFLSGALLTLGTRMKEVSLLSRTLSWLGRGFSSPYAAGAGAAASFFGIGKTKNVAATIEEAPANKKIAKTGIIPSLAPWFLVGTAVASYGVMLYNAYEKVKEATRIHEEWNKRVYDTNYLTEGLSYRERYLKLSYDTQLNINEKTREYIRLRKEELGLISDAVDKSHKTTLGEKYKESIDSTTPSIWNRLAGLQESALAYEELSKLKLPHDITEKYSLGSMMSGGMNPTSYAFIQRDGYVVPVDEFRKEIYSYDAGFTSPEAAEIIDEFKKKLEQNPQDATKIYKMLLERVKEYGDRISGNISGESFDKLLKRPLSDILKTNMGFEGFRRKIYDYFWGETNENAGGFAALQNLNNIKEKWSAMDQLKFFGAYGVSALRGNDGNGTSLDDLAKEFSFDAKKRMFIDSGSKLASDYAKEFAMIAQDVVSVMSLFPPDFRSKFTLLSEPIFASALQQSNFDNKNIKLINGKWHEFVPDGVSQDGGSWQPITDPLKIPPTGGGDGGNESDYKSRYKSNSAAPKQIIVKIENLMNVESIDLTNPDNVAVLETVRSQMQQVLVDVVHDFDASFHG